MWCQVRVLRRIVILTIIIPFQVRTTTWTIITPNPTNTAIIQRNDRLGSLWYGEASTTMRSYRCRTNLDDGRIGGGPRLLQRALASAITLPLSAAIG